MKDRWKQLQQLKRDGGVLEDHSKRQKKIEERAKEWQVTIGLEIHAQLNTERKLFSGTFSASLERSGLRHGIAKIKRLIDA